jgi:hypothetical protein
VRLRLHDCRDVASSLRATPRIVATRALRAAPIVPPSDLHPELIGQRLQPLRHSDVLAYTPDVNPTTAGGTLLTSAMRELDVLAEVVEAATLVSAIIGPRCTTTRQRWPVVTGCASTAD